MTIGTAREIKKIGYCTNLTLHTIEAAHEANVDLIVTHHDAWSFIYGLKEACDEKLKAYGIGHYFNHLPLDDSSFGTNDELAKALGLRIIERTHLEDGFYCGRICEFETPVPLKVLQERLEKLMDEPVKVWQFGNELVKRVGIVCGAGGFTPVMQVAVEKACDVFITGENLLYSIEYADFVKMNLIIGSHTFTELPGVKGLIMKIQEAVEDVEVMVLEEEHLEAIPHQL